MEPVKPRRMGVVIAGVVAVLGLAAVALLSHKAPVPVVEKKAPLVEHPVVKADRPAAPDVTILVDSEPPGAEILRGDVRLGDTPANLVLVGGKTETIVLHKAGYMTATVTLSANGQARKIVRLTRFASARPKEPQVAVPPPRPTTASPATANTATANPATAKQPPVKHMAEHREDPKKGSEIINPY